MMVQRDLVKQNMKVSFLDGLIKKIEPGNIYNIITQKVINPYLFVMQATKESTIEELYIVTYAINQKASKIFFNLMDDGLIKNWTLLVNENMRFRMKGKEGFLLAEEEKRDNFRIIKKRNHAKITLIKQKNKRLVISGSGNYSENPKIEQYTVCDDSDLYEFHKSWIEDVTL